jgi:hypothetical protein
MNKTRKNGLPDLRFMANKIYAKRQFRHSLWGLAVLGALAGIILTITFYRATHKPLLRPCNGSCSDLHENIDVGSNKPGAKKLVIPVEAQEPSDEYYHSDPLRYIRHRCGELGIEDYTCTRFIKVAKCESGLRPTAQNPHSTARGIYQIVIGTWEANDCDGKRTDFIANIECAFKIFKARGFQPWNASKGCWNQ